MKRYSLLIILTGSVVIGILLGVIQWYYINDQEKNAIRTTGATVGQTPQEKMQALDRAAEEFARLAAQQEETCRRLEPDLQEQCRVQAKENRARVYDAINELRESVLENKFLEKFYTRKYVYNAPDTMFLGDRVQITFALGDEPEEAETKFHKSFQDTSQGGIRTGSLRSALVITAELSGADFEILPQFSEAKRFVPLGSATEWSWNVTPLRSGKNKLFCLKVFTQVTYPKSNLAPIEVVTLRETIDVDVPVWDRVVSFLGPFSLMIGVVAACATIFAFLWQVGFIRFPRR
jgi:hypothetical protein